MSRPSGANIADQLAARWWPTEAAYEVAGQAPPRVEAARIVARTINGGPDYVVAALAARPDVLRRLLASP